MPAFIERLVTVQALKYDGTNGPALRVMFGVARFFNGPNGRLFARTPNGPYPLSVDDYVFQPDGLDSIFVLAESDFLVRFQLAP